MSTELAARFTWTVNCKTHKAATNLHEAIPTKVDFISPNFSQFTVASGHNYICLAKPVLAGLFRRLGTHFCPLPAFRKVPPGDNTLTRCFLGGLDLLKGVGGQENLA